MTLEEAILKKEDVIISTVLGHLNVTFDQVRSRSRKTEIVFARHLIHWICWRETDLSLRQIGNVLGMCFDHSTVINSTKKVAGWIERNSRLRDLVHMIYDSCLATIAITNFQKQVNTDHQINRIVESIEVAMEQFPYNNCASF